MKTCKQVLTQLLIQERKIANQIQWKMKIHLTKFKGEKMKKFIAIGLVLLVSALLFEEQPKAKSKFEGQTIVVKLSPDIAMSGLKAKTEQFEKEY